MILTIKALREKMEAITDEMLASIEQLGDPDRPCEECGRRNIDCLRDAYKRNIERALERGRRFGVPEE